MSVTKRTVYRASTQEFSNTYHYEKVGDNPDAAGAEAILDEIVAAEKVFHSGKVTFVHGRVWSAGGNVTQNQMIFEKGLSGTGAALTVVGFHPEFAYLFQWDAGQDSLGRTVRLKKWYHACGRFGDTHPPTDVMEGEIGFTTTERQTMQNQMATVGVVGPNSDWTLCGPTGRNIEGNTPIAHRFLEHHQLGDQWRG